MAVNIFKVMGATVNSKRQLTEEEINAIPAWIYGRYLAGHGATMGVAMQLNVFHKIPMEYQVKAVQSVAQGRIKYIAYVGSKGKTSSTKDLELLQTHFKINPERAQEYLDCIAPEELAELKKIYRVS